MNNNTIIGGIGDKQTASSLTNRIQGDHRLVSTSVAVIVRKGVVAAMRAKVVLKWTVVVVVFVVVRGDVSGR